MKEFTKGIYQRNLSQEFITGIFQRNFSKEFIKRDEILAVKEDGIGFDRWSEGVARLLGLSLTVYQLHTKGGRGYDRVSHVCRPDSIVPGE